MQLQWLKHTGAPSLVVVFGGWAVGHAVVSHLSGPQDVLFIDDYRTLDNALPDLSAYVDVSLVAWSFGVASYAHWQADHADPFVRKIALCGSLDPVNRSTGIPPVAFAKTREGLSAASYQMFLTRCFGARQPEAAIDVAQRRAELDAVADRGAAPDPGFDRIWIAQRDKIFPVANMQRAWGGQACTVLDAPHVPFAGFDCWEDLWR